MSATSDRPAVIGNVPVAHTPGPWEVVRHSHADGELWLSVNQHADTDGMKQWIAELKYLTTGDAEQWANARLIAAAPDLLAFARAIRADASAYFLHRAADMVIAKAEGR